MTSNSNPVLPVGPKPAKLMIVGEYPGREESRAGAPFVGASGNLLDNALRAAGVRREEVYLTYASKFPPPLTNKKGWLDANRKSFRQILEAEIKKVQPEAILALGEEAFQSLWSKYPPISKARGSWFPAGMGEVPILPTLPPAWFNRGMHHKLPLFYWDIQKWAKGYKEPEGEIILSYPLPPETIEKFESAETLVCDTEWFSPNDFAYIGFSTLDGTAVCFSSDSRSMTLAKRWLKEKHLIFQNGMFDVVALRRQGYEVSENWDDTLVAFHTLYPDIGQKDLGTLGSIYSAWPYHKDEVEFVGRDDRKAREYCAKDCLVTGEVWNGIKQDFVREGDAGYKISIGLGDTFARAGELGIRISRRRFDSLRKDLQAEIDTLQTQLEAVVGAKVNVNSSQQVQRLCEDLLKIRNLNSTRQDKLMDLAAQSEDPLKKVVLTAIIRIRQKRKLISAFLHNGVIGEDGRARTSWNIAGTKSGRLASRKPWWPGLPFQTLPVTVRSIFIPDPGNVFVGWDLRQAEARVVAIKTQDFELLEAMDSGIDIHCLLGSQLNFGMSYDDFMARKAVEGGDFKERYLSKKLRHSLNYKGSWVTVKDSINRDYLDTGIGVTAAKAKELHAATMAVHPYLEGWWDRVRMEIRRTGFLETSLGRRRNFGIAGPFSDALWREAISFEPQSTIADLTSLSIQRLDRIWEQGSRGTILAHMHDGVLCQVPEERLDDALNDIREATNQTLVIDGQELVVPIDLKWSDESWAKM
jgi:uracil-DNA glycosylase family 4